MTSKIGTLFLFALLAPVASLAQQTAAHHAEERVAAYVNALGVDESTAKSMVKLYTEAENAVAPLRAECANIQAKINESMAPFDEKAESMLTEEQRSQLAKLKKEGAWAPGTASCAPKAEAKSCGSGAAKGAAGGGCCAGKGAH